jgi:hypothetical protein
MKWHFHKAHNWAHVEISCPSMCFMSETTDYVSITCTIGSTLKVIERIFVVSVQYHNQRYMKLEQKCTNFLGNGSSYEKKI